MTKLELSILILIIAILVGAVYGVHQFAKTCTASKGVLVGGVNVLVCIPESLIKNDRKD